MIDNLSSGKFYINGTEYTKNILTGTDINNGSVVYLWIQPSSSGGASQIIGSVTRLRNFKDPSGNALTLNANSVTYSDNEGYISCNASNGEVRITRLKNFPESTLNYGSVLFNVEFTCGSIKFGITFGIQKLM